MSDTLCGVRLEHYTTVILNDARLVIQDSARDEIHRVERKYERHINLKPLKMKEELQ